MYYRSYINETVLFTSTAASYCYRYVINTVYTLIVIPVAVMLLWESVLKLASFFSTKICCLFGSTQEDWTSYIERLQQYFTANDVAEDKQRAILLSACGIATYCLIKSLTAPDNPATKTFAHLFKMVEEHHNPTPSVTALKPGRVTFCPGHPGQTRFKKYPGLTRIGSCELRN